MEILTRGVGLCAGTFFVSVISAREMAGLFL